MGHEVSAWCCDRETHTNTYTLVPDYKVVPILVSIRCGQDVVNRLQCCQCDFPQSGQTQCLLSDSDCFLFSGWLIELLCHPLLPSSITASDTALH